MTNGNDSAYPLPETEVTTPTVGLTKREYFAAMAMQGLMASADADGAVTLMAMAKEQASSPPQVVAEIAVTLANTLIEELNK